MVPRRISRYSLTTKQVIKNGEYLENRLLFSIDIHIRHDKGICQRASAKL